MPNIVIISGVLDLIFAVSWVIVFWAWVWRKKFEEVCKRFPTISSFSADPHEYGNRFLVAVTILIGGGISSIMSQEYLSRHDNGIGFFLRLIVSLIFPLAGLFYTDGNGLHLFYEPEIFGFVIPIIVSTTIHSICALSFFVVHPIANLLYCLEDIDMAIAKCALFFTIPSLICLVGLLVVQGIIHFKEEYKVDPHRNCHLQLNECNACMMEDVHSRETYSNSHSLNDSTKSAKMEEGKCCEPRYKAFVVELKDSSCYNSRKLVAVVEKISLILEKDNRHFYGKPTYSKNQVCVLVRPKVVEKLRKELELDKTLEIEKTHPEIPHSILKPNVVAMYKASFLFEFWLVFTACASSALVGIMRNKDIWS